MTDRRTDQHGLLCRAYNPAPILRHVLREPESDVAYWRDRLDDRCGEVVFGLLLAGGRMVLTRTGEYPDGVYRVPSGGIGHGEAVIDALYREVAEELGRPFEVLWYAGMIDFHFPGQDLHFPSYCFLLSELPAADGRCPAPTDTEIEEVLEATPAKLDRMLRVLDVLVAPWADWGPYRSASSKLVASAWAERRATCEDHPSPDLQTVDISLPVHSQMARYPGDPPIDRNVVTDRPKGSQAPAWLVSRWDLSAHAGTHVDAPAHLFPRGATADQIPLRLLCGPGLMVDCRRAVAAGRPVAPNDLPDSGELCGRIVLLKLGLGARLAAGEYDPEVPVLSGEGARYLVSAGARAVGVESLSADPAGAEPAAHLALLGAGVPLIEGLDLSRAGAGEWEVFVLPLRLSGAEAAPCRAVLRRPFSPPPDRSERAT